MTSDTHRGDHVGALGPGAPVRTPAIDALAARGVLYTDAYAASNTTNPSHGSLMTGLPVRDTRVLDNSSPLVDDARTLAEAFRDAGYHTLAAVSVRHLMDDESGFGQGFERMAGPSSEASERPARATTTQAVAWLDELADEPVFLWVHVFDAHSPYEPPASTDRRYYPKGKDPFDPSQRLQYDGRFLPVYLRGLTDVEFPYAQYRAEIDALDGELERLLAHPRALAGVTALTADHGESFGAHGIWWDHAGLYPDTLHVPLVLAWPGGPHGVRCDAPVEQMHLGRTLLDAAGLVASEFRGADLRAAAAGAAIERPRYSLAKEGHAASLLEGGWFLVLNLSDYQTTAMARPRARHTVELYDLAHDPAAANDLAEREPARAKAMRAKLVEWLGGASARGLAGAGAGTAEQKRRLASLGYTGDGPSEDARAGRWIEADCDCAQCARWRD
ncbi:MAG: sulfatase [Planctomycetes bacterium]|nr:sulfatase [Planctomycetota bacterium]